MTALLAFDRLARPVQKWIRSQGWSELRPLQVQAIEAILGGPSDQIIAASTAGGKTEAAFLPLISQVLDQPGENGFDLLYIGPLKALITDQTRRLDEICHEAELPVIPWHGDISATVKSRALKRPQGILLITPESLEALFIRHGPRIGGLFAGTRAVVIDELHTMLESERGMQLRSLLTRLDARLGRRLRRIGLSATLGDMGLACACLSPDNPEAVGRIEVKGGGELKVQLRGYVSGDPGSPSTTEAITDHLFTHLRGQDNLVFAGRRAMVEIYADQLRERCEAAGLPLEFYPHHASLARDHRDFVERRLKDGRLPTTAVCTSTLELGIDIGDVTCIAQIGAPFSVASIRQRLGRSGRRPGQPAILRQYAVEARLQGGENIADRLRLGLLRAIAMIELMTEGWCEPPETRALHLSTLVHQILAVIAERGGAQAATLFTLLCRHGPFRSVDQPLFMAVLRAMGRPEAGLIEQPSGGLLLLGPRGEQLVDHYSFYAVFQTPEEFRLVHGVQDLGSLPVENMLAPGMLLVFSGRRWQVQSVHAAERIVMVTPARAGVPPVFDSHPGLIHDRVVERMIALLGPGETPVWLDRTAAALLAEARHQFALMPFDDGDVVVTGPSSFVIATRCGTRLTQTLALALQSCDYQVQQHDGFLDISGPGEIDCLRGHLSGFAEGRDLIPPADAATAATEKFHPWLTPGLIWADDLSSRLEVTRLPTLCRRLIDGTIAASK